MTELEFGARLKQLRQEKRLTQQELADQLGVSNKSVSRWESGGYPDIATLAPLAKALGVSVDELLGCQPPLRSFGRSDWQNLMSYAFALGGGVVFYLFDLFMPVVICYLLYLAMMAYGIYLQRHYTYHSHWFYGANALMDFFVNLQLTAFVVGGGVLLTGAQNLTVIMNYMMQADIWELWSYLGRLLLYLLPWFFLALVLTGVTQWVICRTAGKSAQGLNLALRFTRPELAALPPVLSPVLLGGFWWFYNAEDAARIWFYENQTLLFFGLWLVLTVLVVLYMYRLCRGKLFLAGGVQLGCLLFPLLAGRTRAYGTFWNRFIDYSKHLAEGSYIAFGQFNGRILATTMVLILLYLLCCMVKVEKKDS